MGARDPFVERLIAIGRAVGPQGIIDQSAWWRDADVLRDIGPALTALFAGEEITVVVGVEARGFVVGPLVASFLGVGFAEVRKNTHPNDAGEALLRRTMPPGYSGDAHVLTMRRHLVQPRDRALFVDEWITTGATATTVRDLIEDAGATWVGGAVVADQLESGRRRQLGVRSLLRAREIAEL